MVPSPSLRTKRVVGTLPDPVARSRSAWDIEWLACGLRQAVTKGDANAHSLPAGLPVYCLQTGSPGLQEGAKVPMDDTHLLFILPLPGVFCHVREAQRCSAELRNLFQV